MSTKTPWNESGDRFDRALEDEDDTPYLKGQKMAFPSTLGDGVVDVDGGGARGVP